MPRERVVCLKRDGGCGRRFWRNEGDAREMCPDCAPAEATGAVVRLQNATPLPETPDDVWEDADDPSERPGGSVTAATLKELTARKRQHTPYGQAALVVAQKLDAGFLSGTEMAALTKALRETLRDALAGAAAAGDEVDELKARRAGRVGRGA